MFEALLEILLLKFGSVKYFAEEKRETKEHKYSAISDEDLAGFMESLEGEEVESVEVQEKSGDFNGVDKIEFTLKVKNKITKVIRIVPVPSECFIISKNAKTKAETAKKGEIKQEITFSDTGKNDKQVHVYLNT